MKKHRLMWDCVLGCAALGSGTCPLSASRLAQPVSAAPAAVTVIDRQMIASGFRHLADLMRLVPCV